MSTTELVIPTKPKYLAAAGAQQALTEFAGGVAGAGSALPTLSIRGKVFRARLNGQEQELSKTRELEVVLVAARPAVSKRYYEGAYVSGSVDFPDCASTDGRVPDSGDNRQAPTCGECPHNVFGSGRMGTGKACSDYKRLVVLPFVGTQLVKTPCVLDVPATSLRVPKAMRGGTEMMLREYLGALERHQITDPTAVVSQVAFTGAEHPQLHWTFARYASEEMHALVQELRTSEDVLNALGGDAHEAPAPIAVATKPILAPAPIPAPIVASAEAAPIPAPIVASAEAAPKPARASARKSAPTPAPTPGIDLWGEELEECASADANVVVGKGGVGTDADADDIMAEVRKLLGELA